MSHKTLLTNCNFISPETAVSGRKYALSLIHPSRSLSNPARLNVSNSVGSRKLDVPDLKYCEGFSSQALLLSRQRKACKSGLRKGYGINLDPGPLKDVAGL